MIVIEYTLSFPGRYIAEPYWPEMARLIDIQKESGVNRARSDASRRKTLDAYLSSHGMTLAEYEQLEKDARRPFHTDQSGQIIIPGDRVASFAVCCCHQARSAQRPCPPDQMRSTFTFTDAETGKHQRDGVWERFAVVSSGTGAKLSNQRGLRQSSYIEHFDATGMVEFDETFVKPSKLRDLFNWGGENVGIGASRKMGVGRFNVSSWRVDGQPSEVAA